jgi:hypothetical protein
MNKDHLKTIRHFNSVFLKILDSPSKKKQKNSSKTLIQNFNNSNIIDIFYEMIDSIKNENFLHNYRILSNKEKIKRSYILKLMKQFILSKKIKLRIIYLSIFFLDLLMKKNKNELTLEQIGLGSLILVSKFFYEKYYNITNKMFRNFNNKKFSNEELNLIEIECLKLLNYKFNKIQPINFLELLSFHGIVFKNDNLKKEDINKIYNFTLKLLEYFMAVDNEYIKYNPFKVACSIVAICRKKYNLEKWPENLEKTFKICFNDFEDTYNFLYNYYKGMKNENIEKYKSMSLEKNYSKPNIVSKQKSMKKMEETEINDIEMDTNKINNQLSYNSPQKISSFVGLNSAFIKSPISEKKNLNPSFKKNLFLGKNFHKSIDENIPNCYENNNNIISERFKKNLKKDSFGGLFRQKTRNLKTINTNLICEVQLNNNSKKNNEKNKQVINVNIFNSESSLNNNNSPKNLKSNSNLSSLNIKDDNKRMLSLEHYKRFNISLNHKIPNNLIEKRIKNLSTIVNHLYSNHNNNIL